MVSLIFCFVWCGKNVSDLVDIIQGCFNNTIVIKLLFQSQWGNLRIALRDDTTMTKVQQNQVHISWDIWLFGASYNHIIVCVYRYNSCYAIFCFFVFCTSHHKSAIKYCTIHIQSYQITTIINMISYAASSKRQQLWSEKKFMTVICLVLYARDQHRDLFKSNTSPIVHMPSELSKELWGLWAKTIHSSTDMHVTKHTTLSCMISTVVIQGPFWVK